MKLYRKKLDSLDALKREKIRLRYQRLRTNSNDPNPLAEIGRGKKSADASSGMLGTLMGLASSKSQLQMALTIAKPLLRLMRNRRPKAREMRYAVDIPRKPSAVKKILTEIAVSYIIGKALQLSVTAFRKYRKRRKIKQAMHAS